MSTVIRALQEARIYDRDEQRSRGVQRDALFDGIDSRLVVGSLIHQENTDLETMCMCAECNMFDGMFYPAEFSPDWETDDNGDDLGVDESHPDEIHFVGCIFDATEQEEEQFETHSLEKSEDERGKESPWEAPELHTEDNSEELPDLLLLDQPDDPNPEIEMLLKDLETRLKDEQKKMESGKREPRNQQHSNRTQDAKKEFSAGASSSKSMRGRGGGSSSRLRYNNRNTKQQNK
uniref:Uncharacterized protein n=2 Tax=Timspurckia oligopyrenoides TaxID=708627 RepID=A0A7S1EQ13_9RHOD|mmetsp:Transcript_11823/g.21380  ORF Transcript_11823/g.21380 Transcript_11823/m.21380 type:complete len:234 (+) Transcript_11823:671-1372(+)